MKRKSSIKKADKKRGDYFVKRKGVLFRLNKLDPRRKLRQG
jgi:ribosomal protein L36